MVSKKSIEAIIRFTLERKESATFDEQFDRHFSGSELLTYKLKGSGLENYLEVDAMIEGETEKKLIQKIGL